MLLGDIEIPKQIFSLPSNTQALMFQLDFNGLISKDFIPIFFVIFLLVNIDTAGALISLSYSCPNTKNDDTKKTMISDSISVMLAPLFGTTTPGAYIDSMTGIKAGGKTGLTAITVGVLFLIGMLFAPLIMIIPPYAYAPALLYVGILMSSAITKANFNDISEFAPILLTICTMIFTYNIGSGIIVGFIVYPITKLLCGQKNETNTITWIMFVLSLIYFAIFPN